MKTKVITLHTPQLRDDLRYSKYCISEELSYQLRETPLNVDIDKEIECIRTQAISESVNGKIMNDLRDKLLNDMTVEWVRDMDLIYIECLINGLPLPIEWGFTDKGFGPTKYLENK
jgi:hypothetical protein